MMDITYSAPNTIQVPSHLSEVSNLNFGTILDFKQLSYGILKKMTLDSKSTVHMLVDTPSSQLWERIRRNGT